MKKKNEDKEAEFVTWTMTDSSKWRRGWRKRVRDVSLIDPITDPENSLFFSDPIFDYY